VRVGDSEVRGGRGATERQSEGQQEREGSEKKNVKSQRKCDFQSLRISKQTLSDDD